MGGLTIDLTGRTALVTGGTRGIGAAIAARLREAGARVMICGRTPPEGGSKDFIACDVRDPDAVSEMMDEIEKRAGGLDILVNNAGGSPEVDAATVSPRFSEKIIALNLVAPMHTARFAHRLLAARRGSIVNISSVSAQRPSPGTAAYAAAKAGLSGWTSSLALEWGPDVRINNIITGYVETEDTEATYGDAAAQERISRNIGARRLARSEEIADAVVWLSSEMASYVTGADIRVDGGGERPAWLAVRGA